MPQGLLEEEEEVLEEEEEEATALVDSESDQEFVVESENDEEEEEEEDNDDDEDEKYADVDSSELAQALYEQFSESSGAQEAVLAEVTAGASDITNTIRGTVHSLRSYAQTAINYMNKVPRAEEFSRKISSMVVKLGTKVPPSCRFSSLPPSSSLSLSLSCGHKARVHRRVAWLILIFLARFLSSLLLCPRTNAMCPSSRT